MFMQLLPVKVMAQTVTLSFIVLSQYSGLDPLSPQEWRLSLSGKVRARVYKSRAFLRSTIILFSSFLNTILATTQSYYAPIDPSLYSRTLSNLLLVSLQLKATIQPVGSQHLQSSTLN
jgi:hypothetical protein